MNHINRILEHYRTIYIRMSSGGEYWLYRGEHAYYIDEMIHNPGVPVLRNVEAYSAQSLRNKLAKLKLA